MKNKQLLFTALFFLTLVALVFTSCSKDEDPKIEVSASQVYLPNNNNPITFTVNSNVPWTASQSGTTTFNVSPTSGQAGTTTVSVSSSSVNTSSEERKTILSINGTGVAATVTLIQPSATFSISPTTLAMENVESSKNFTITSNLTWSIPTNNLPEWIKSITPSSGEGNGEITITVNDSKNRKEKNTHILRVEYAGTFASIVIEQAPAANTAPTAPTGLIPADGSSNISVAPTFRWDASTDADGDEINYTVSFSKNQTSWTNISAGVNLMATTNISSGVLDENTQYYFKVTADDGYNNGKTESAVVSFTTGVQDAYKDGGYTIYQESNKTNPVKLVFTGDGYLPEHFKYGDLFDQDVNRGIEGLFSIEPYKTYREYFTVYKVAAYSQETGISNKSTNVTRNTAFSCVMEGGGSTGISCNDERVRSYALKIPGMTENDLKNNSIAVIINADVYAGTCIMWSNGISIGMIPVHKSASSNQTRFENVVCHEFGGHGFGRLADEYRYSSEELPTDQKNGLKTWQGYGYYLNLSLTADASQVPWSPFIGLPGYSHVGVYAGGYLYTGGVWRSEFISCMEDNRMYFNTQSRYLIFERLMRVAGEDYSIERFIANDVQKTDNTTSETKGWEGVPYDFIPLAPPIMIEVK